MADWADEKAYELTARSTPSRADGFLINRDGYCMTGAEYRAAHAKEIAAALRSARADALEEAAKVADAAVSQQLQGRKIATAIRALKDKP